MQLEDKTKILTEEDKRKIINIIKVHESLLGTPKLLDEACEKCGGKVYCCHGDLGGVDYYDNYWHVCLGCDSINKHTEHYSSWMSADPVKCPFCTPKK